METYKKPVVASKYAKNLLPSVVIFPIAIARKISGDDDFHKEESLTPRKKAID